MDENESITKELRSVNAVTLTEMLMSGKWDGYRAVLMSTTLRGSISDRIDERFTHELEAKQAEIDALKYDNADLQARLDASIQPPVDIDGARWTGEDVDKPFAPTDGGKATEGIVREIVYDWPHEGWFIVDQYDTHYPADKCHHGTLEPPDSQERIDADARKDFDEYWGCKDIDDCGDCPARMDGDEPWYSYGTDGSCREAQILDLLRRQRELDVAGEQA